MKRRILTVAVAMALIVIAAPSAQAQTGFGVRVASLDVEGDNMVMDSNMAYGAHVSLGFFPFFKFQLGAEYLSGEIDYDFGGIYQLPDQDFQSLGVFLDVRKPFGLIPMFPLKVVVGGGLNVNLMKYYDRQMVEDFIDGVTGSIDLENFTKTGYHLMGGLLFKPPILPFTITAEYRMQTIKLEDDTLKNNGFVIGITFGF